MTHTADVRFEFLGQSVQQCRLAEREAKFHRRPAQTGADDQSADAYTRDAFAILVAKTDLTKLQIESTGPCNR